MQADDTHGSMSLASTPSHTYATSTAAMLSGAVQDNTASQLQPAADVLLTTHTDDFTDDSADDSTALPSLLYDDIDHPTASTTTLLLTAQHNHTTQQLHSTITQLTQQLTDSQQQTTRYKAQCAVFVRNISVLYETAVSEVRRKQDEIDRLKEWKAAQERRTRMVAAERQQNNFTQQQQHYAFSTVAVGSGTSNQQQSVPAPPIKRAHHTTVHQPHLPLPPFPPPPLDNTRKRARVDTG